jgi:hypothetical protein
MTGKSQKSGASTKSGSWQKSSVARSRKQPPPTQSPWLKYRTLLIGLAAVAGVLVIVFILLQSASGKTYACGSLLTAPPVQAVSDTEPGFITNFLGNKHVPVGSTITYGFCPPTSGNHYYSGNRGPVPAAVYGPATEQSPGGWVHNLEHGSVVLLYRCPSAIPGQGDCPSSTEMTTMQQWFNDTPSDDTCGRQAVVARFDAMSTRFAVVAWNRALLLETFDNLGLALADNFAKAWTDVTAPEPTLC